MTIYFYSFNEINLYMNSFNETFPLARIFPLAVIVIIINLFFVDVETVAVPKKYKNTIL